MKEQLTGTIESFSNNYGYIRADDGDLYDFKSTLKLTKGNKVIFEPVDSQEAFDMALLGGPIPSINVRLL